MTQNYEVFFGDSDPAGYLYFSKFFDFAHKNVERYILNLVPQDSWFSNSDYVVPIKGASAEYLKPLPCFTKFQITSTVLKHTNSTITFESSFLNESALFAKIHTTHCFVSNESKNKIEIPPAIKEKFSLRGF